MKMISILVLGYYDRMNLGDDIFQFVFQKYIFTSKDYMLKICNIDDIENNLKDETLFDLIVLGGGDIINNYFLNDKTITLLRNYSLQRSIPIVFYSIGLTYTSLLPLLDISDRLYIRNKVDYRLIQRRYGSQCVVYTPDISYFLLKEDSLINYKRMNSNIQKIGVCFPYTWFANSTDNIKFFEQLVSFINNLSKTYQVYIIPFDVSSNSSNSDLILINQLKNVIPNNENRVFYMDSQNITLDVMIEYFKQLDCIIASRFHSVMLSIFTTTPFVALYSTKKIENLQSELSYELNKCFIKINTNQDLVPIAFDETDVMKTIDYIVENYSNIIQMLENSKNQSFSILQKSHQDFQNYITNSSIRKKRFTPPQYISPIDKRQIIGNTVHNILNKFGQLTIRNIDKVYKGVPLMNVLFKRNNISLAIQQTLAEEIIWQLTGDPYAPYYYGLCEFAHIKPLIPQLEWLIDNYYENFYYNPIQLNNITVVNKNFQELHRSGWQYIVDNILRELSVMNIKINNNQPLIIDTYVDKTFHWNSQFYNSKKVIPYTNDWIGFIHHTYSSYNNKYNCEELFKNPLFLSSLEKCKCLIVMTEYLKKQIEESLSKINYKINVYVLYHPTEETEQMFNWDNFLTIKNKQIVQIGNWLRNVFGIYEIELPKTSIIQQKCVLKNRNSENYFLPETFFETMFNFLNIQNYNNNMNNNIVDICKISFENMHVKGMYEFIEKAEESVQIIEFLDNQQYDELLSHSIVFLKLADASAVNTIIECILRNTPVIVNNIEPVVEILGHDYPLYYTSSYEVSQILDSPLKLKAGVEYLSTMDKTPFLISTFVNNFKNIIQNL
jgi:polysaccharide pyruvyl transferase WcaK-like protein